MDDEELPTSVCQEGSLYMHYLHYSVNCPDTHFAKTLWQCFQMVVLRTAGGMQRNLGNFF
jgi:hypothetical protein